MLWFGSMVRVALWSFKATVGATNGSGRDACKPAQIVPRYAPTTMATDYDIGGEEDAHRSIATATVLCQRHLY